MFMDAHVAKQQIKKGSAANSLIQNTQIYRIMKFTEFLYLSYKKTFLRTVIPTRHT